jgi:hydroxyacid-oxoacid transhydrogenase
VSVAHPQHAESVFTYGAPGLKFGPGSRHELGHDLAQLSARRVLVVTDPGVAATGGPAEIADVLRAASIEVVVFAESRVEPTDASLEHAIAFARAEGRSTPSSPSVGAAASTPPRR